MASATLDKLGQNKELTDLLLQACRGVQVMATSQEALGLPGEVVLRVPPMAPDLAAPSEFNRLVLRRSGIALAMPRHADAANAAL